MAFAKQREETVYKYKITIQEFISQRMYEATVAVQNREAYCDDLWALQNLPGYHIGVELIPSKPEGHWTDVGNSLQTQSVPRSGLTGPVCANVDDKKRFFWTKGTCILEKVDPPIYEFNEIFLDCQTPNNGIPIFTNEYTSAPVNM